ncbi:MAG: cobalt transporter CbiM [Magnetospirillum sp.]|nr:cobalt transporter CbiM [Magnetospirillum sp.]
MAHIPDGVLSPPVLAIGAALAVAGTGLGLKALPPERVPAVAMLSAVFFVAALVHLPVGPSSVHLILNGLMGAALGWAAVPAIVVALVLQAVLFGFGGLVVLGTNVTNMAVPALIAGWVFRSLWRARPRNAALAGAVAGGVAVALTALMVAGSLALSGREFWPAARLVTLTYVPVAIIEAAFTAAAIGLVARVRPDLLEAAR